MMDDCVKYVLQAEYPAEIIDIDEYMTILGDQRFDRNAVGAENAIGELPEIYKSELSNRLFSAYVHAGSSTILRSNIEFVSPILWRVLPKEVKVQIVRRVDREISSGNVDSIGQAFAFVRLVNSQGYLTTISRRYKVQPLVEKLRDNLDNWKEENEAVRALEPYASVVPAELLQEYVSALTQTYVGKIGFSVQFGRTDFFADGAALIIPKMFEAFDDRAAQAFIEVIRGSKVLRERIRNPQKLQRLRALANTVLERASGSLADRGVLEALVDENREEEFLGLIGRRTHNS